MQSQIVFVCTHCPRPTGEYEDIKHLLGTMREQEYICPKCGVCRSCGHEEGYELGEELFLTGGSD